MEHWWERILSFNKHRLTCEVTRFKQRQEDNAMDDNEKTKTTWEWIIPSLRYGFDETYDPPVFDVEGTD